MKVLCLTNALPTDENPQMGIFVKEQIDSLRALGVDIVPMVVKGYKSRLNYLKAMTKLRKIISHGNYDLIHAHYGLTGVVACTQKTLPVVVTFHGDDVFGTPSKTGRTTFASRILARLNKSSVRNAAAIIVQSAEMKAKLGLDRAQVIPFGIDFSLFRPVDRGEACRLVGMDPARRRILFANNPAIPVKQFALAEKVFGMVKARMPETELVVTGKRPREEVPLVMNACDALILTSLHEGSPTVVKEAMACDLPVVSVDVGDVREIVGKSTNCFVTTREPEEMADRILHIFCSGRRSDGRGNIGHLEIGNVARRVMGVYEKVLAGR